VAKVALIIACAPVPGHRGGQLCAPGEGAIARDALTVGEERDLEVVMKNEAELASSGILAGEEPAPSRPEEVQP
jgi:hypothetical protein